VKTEKYTYRSSRTIISQSSSLSIGLIDQVYKIAWLLCLILIQNSIGDKLTKHIYRGYIGMSFFLFVYNVSHKYSKFSISGGNEPMKKN